MEFWGVEVKNGESVKVEPGDDKILHVSQASLGELKKDRGNEPIYLYLKVNNKKFVLATLSHEKFPQVSLDVVFHKEFELSHSLKNGSVYITGYKVEAPEGSESDYDSEEDEELPQVTNKNVKVESKPNKAEPGSEKASAAKSDNAKKHVNFKEPNKDAKPKEEDDGDDDYSSSEESSDEELVPGVNGEDGSSDDNESDDDDSDEDETSDDETPKKPEPSKKRPAESPLKTPVSDKKAKSGTTKKSAGGHVATPYPSKQGGKKPGNSEQMKPQQTTPKSAGSYPCKSCNRSFTSETGLQSHTKAKHGTAA